MGKPSCRSGSAGRAVLRGRGACRRSSHESSVCFGPPVFSWTGGYVGGHVGAGWRDGQLMDFKKKPPEGGSQFTLTIPGSHCRKCWL